MIVNTKSQRINLLGAFILALGLFGHSQICLTIGTIYIASIIVENRQKRTAPTQVG